MGTLYLNKPALSPQWRFNLVPYVRVAGVWREADSWWTRRGAEWDRSWSKIPNAVGALSLATNPTWSTISFTWAAVPTATSYAVYRGSAKLRTVTAANSGVISDHARGSTYTYTVRAINAAGAEGAASPAYRYFSGANEVRDSGSVSVSANCIGSGSWRGDVGWGYTGDDVRLGYYSSPYSGDSYVGGFTYGAGGVRAAIIARCGGGTLGTTRVNNGSGSGSVYMTKKPGVGTSGAVIVSFYTTNSPLSGGKPGFVTPRHDVTSTASGAAKWYALRNDFITALANNSARGICIYNNWNPQPNYAAFQGVSEGASNGDLSITWSWNYRVSAAQPTTWKAV